MTVITRATLGNTLPIFIRDVIKENCSITIVFKGTPDKNAIDLDTGTVIINLEKEGWENLVLRGRRLNSIPLALEIQVWANKFNTRDTISGKIMNVLSDETKTDGTDSIRSKHLNFESIFGSTDDFYHPDFPKLIKRKNINVNYKYSGA